MELVSTIEINGEEREIADAYARGQIDGINESLSDLEYLGWSVPDKCYLKNYKDTNEAFHQKVGRVFVGGNTSLSSYNITLNGAVAISYSALGISLEEKKNILCCATLEPITESEMINGKIGYHVAPIDDYIYVNIKGSASSLDEFKASVNASPLVFYYKLDSEKIIIDGNEDVTKLKNDLSDCRKKSDITTNETLIGTFNGKNYYRKLFTGIGASGSSITVNVGEKIEIYNYYGRAYTYGQSGASDVKYPIPNKNYYIESQSISETSFQLTIPTSSDMRKVDLVIEYTKVDE